MSMHNSQHLGKLNKTRQTHNNSVYINITDHIPTKKQKKSGCVEE